MEKWKKRAVQLVWGLMFEGRKNPAVVEYKPQKTELDKKEIKFFKRKAPEKTGISPKRIAALLKALEEERRANIHSLMIIKDGAVICECSHPGYSVNEIHLAHSMSKTVTGIGIGLLLDEGKISLDDKVCDFFPDVPVINKKLRELTVEHLLRMASGVDFAELGVACEDKWTEAFFTSAPSSAPGEKYKYNSMNSYILANIATRVCKKPFFDYLNEKLFSPLEITNVFWEKSLEGIEKGGFGLYMSCESFAKIGVMLLEGGSFFGRRVLSPETVKLLCSPHSPTPEESGDFDYGYHVWVGRSRGEILMNGMLGQNVWIYKDAGIVVSVNCGNNELFSESPALNIIRSHLTEIPDEEKYSGKDSKELAEIKADFFKSRHWILPLQRRRGLLEALGFRTSEPFDNRWCAVLGEYAFVDNNCGLLPLIVAVFQNNYSCGLERMTIKRQGEGLWFTFKEGEAFYEFEAGLYGFKETVLNIRGEKYALRAMAQAIEDEDRNPVFKLELIFPELPNTRTMKISYSLGRLTVRINESPNEKIAEGFIGSITSSPKSAFIIGLLEKKLGQGFIAKKLAAAFNPTLVGISTARAGFEAIIAAENAISKESRESSGKLLSAIINKFISDGGSDVSEEAAGKEPGFFSKAFSAIFRRDKGEGK